MYLPAYRSSFPQTACITQSIFLEITPKPVRSATPRFGRAVARVRSRHLKRQRKAAASFIRKALKGDDRLDMTKKSHQLWMELANLKPIFQFLAKQWPTTVDHEMPSRCGVPTSKLVLLDATCRFRGGERWTKVWLWYASSKYGFTLSKARW